MVHPFCISRSGRTWLPGRRTASRDERSPFVKYEENGEGNAAKSRHIIPLQLFAQVHDGKNRKYRQRDHFLDGLELRGREFVRANAICRNLEAIFEERDAPTSEDHFPQSFAAILEVAIPGEGHEDVRECQQLDRSHNCLRRIVESLSQTQCNGEPLRGIQSGPRVIQVSTRQKQFIGAAERLDRAAKSPAPPCAFPRVWFRWWPKSSARRAGTAARKNR